MLWQPLELRRQSTRTIQSGQYTGTSALAAYNQATGSTKTYIPDETVSGAGTANANWVEAALGKELMTGYINNSNYLSKYNLMSLADLGYNLKKRTTNTTMS